MKSNPSNEPDPHDLFDIDVSNIHFQVYSNNTIATLSYLPPEFKLIGIGTDAIVVQHSRRPHVVYKVFADETVDKLPLEFEVYQRLQSSNYFPICYGKTDRCLIISREQGPTLYQCLEEGIPIPEQVIQDVEAAILYAKNCGLYPQDIHLKNIILQGQHAKVIDVASYLHPGVEKRWEHLVSGYHQVYPLIRGKKIPPFLIDKVKRMYYSKEGNVQSVFGYVKDILKRLELSNK